MKKSAKLLSVLLCLVLVLSGCDVPQLAQPQETTEAAYSGMTFSKMTYIRPDMAEIQKVLDNACHVATQEVSMAKLLMAIGEYYDCYDDFYTNYRLADIHYCLDMTDPYWEEEYNFCLENADKLEAGLDTLYRALAKSPNRETLDQPANFGPGFLDQYEGESMWDETFSALMNREAQLQGQYYELSSGVYDETFLDETAPELAEILVELVQVRQEMAAYLGYDSYPQFAYDYYYYRTFTPEEAEVYFLEIRDTLVPIYAQVDVSHLQELAEEHCTEETTFAYLKQAADNMGGDIRRAFNTMERSRLYDLTYSENKYPTSFETYLFTYQLPFVFICPTETVLDKLTFAHEFGHFTNDYLCTGSYVGVDVSEVQSQTMEYMALTYGPQDDLLTQYKMVDSLSVYVEQAAMALFEQQMYSLTGEELTAENIQALYEKTCLEFGFDAFGFDPREYVAISHLYIGPMYMPSYVVSNDLAMQIYQLELEEEGKGLELYEECLYSQDAYLADFVDTYGLEDPLTPGRIKQVAEIFQKELTMQ